MALADCPGCKFSPGSFKQQITIQEKTEVQDDTGGMVSVWVNFATVWCRVTPVHGNEQLISQRIDAVNVYNIIMRFLPGVVEKQRILLGSKILQVKSVINIDELSEFMSLKCIDTGPGT